MPDEDKADIPGGWRDVVHPRRHGMIAAGPAPTDPELLTRTTASDLPEEFTASDLPEEFTVRGAGARRRHRPQLLT